MCTDGSFKLKDGAIVQYCNLLFIALDVIVNGNNYIVIHHISLQVSDTIVKL